MSLDTVLKIGKAFRGSASSLKNFKYIKPCPSKKGEFTPTCVSIPVTREYKFNWNEVKLFPENAKPELYYLTFKTSDSDSLVKYIFGDIYFSKNVKVNQNGLIETKEGGYYRLANPGASPAFQKSSFFRGQTDYEDIIQGISEDSALKLFRASLESDIEILEKVLANISAVEEFVTEKQQTTFLEFLNSDALLKEAAVKNIYEKTSNQNKKKLGIESEFKDLKDAEKIKLVNYDHGEIFIHFEFEGGKHWHEFKQDFSQISNKMLSDFIEETPVGLVLNKTLYKTLCSGDLKNDWQFPSFALDNRHKSMFFSNEEIQDLFYALDFCSTGRLISGTDIKIIVLPKGDNLDASHYEEFVKKRFDEGLIKKRNEGEEEPLLSLFEQENEDAITSFDVIFCKKGGMSSPDVDLLEISGIEKSKLRVTRKRIEDIGKEIAKKRKSFLKTDKNLFPFKLEFSFKSILGNPQYDQKTGKVSIKPSPKYQSHVLKVLPLIYTENYHHDGGLLPAFIQNVEYSIRSGGNNFNLLKFDLEFLIRIQNSPTNKFEIMVNSKSYQIGKKLGQLSKPLRKAINSFEKSYVGLITRRVATKYDCVKFTNEITEKLTRHGKRWAEQTASIVSELGMIPEQEYDKELVAFGFLEGYFTYEEKSEDTKRFYSRLEKLLNDFQENESLQKVIEDISTVAQANVVE